MTNLWSSNHPRDFWQCQPTPPEEIWQAAIANALPLLGLTVTKPDMDTILALTLGEERFDQNHWKLGPIKTAYYKVKSFIPRSITRQLRRVYSRGIKTEGIWPIEPRYVYFLWEVLRQILKQGSCNEIFIKDFWPNHHPFAFVITHDIETAAGQEFVKTVADFEESLGFHSLFNFVPERYKINYELMDDLRKRGFEIGVHGFMHDGRLFDSEHSFMQKASRLNQNFKKWNAAGFRAELTHRHPEWMQSLEMEYDLSFFDTDPFEPIPGGTMSIWPFFIGHFVELPYTLVQDYTLTSVLGEKTARLWLEKVNFIEKFHGMALVNTHPDYLKDKSTWNTYSEFLNAMKKRNDYWHALPGEVSRWWKSRMESCTEIRIPDVHLSRVHLQEESIKIEV